MASFNRLPSGKWRAQVRRKGHVLGETFTLKQDAETWARRIESEIDSGKTPTRKNVSGVKTLGALIDLHIADMQEVGKRLGRSKAYSLDLLKDRLGNVHFENLDREKIIQFGKCRAKEGAGPVTFGIDIGYIGTLLTHGAAVLGIEDLHFHDLRHEGTSRLFEAGFEIPQVALVTGHKD